MTKEKPIRGRIQLWADFHDSLSPVLRLVRPDGLVEFSAYQTNVMGWIRSVYTRQSGPNRQKRIARELKRDGKVFLGNL